jgi:carboxypeptidase family protein
LPGDGPGIELLWAMGSGGARRARASLLGAVVVLALVGLLASVLVDRGSKVPGRETPAEAPPEAVREVDSEPSARGSQPAPSPEREELRKEAASSPTAVSEPGREAVIRGRILSTDGSPPPADALVSIVTEDPMIDFPEVAARLGGRRAFQDAVGGPDHHRWFVAAVGLRPALTARAAANGTFSVPVPRDLPKFRVEVEADSARARPRDRYMLVTPDVDPVLTVFVEPGGRIEGSVRTMDGRAVAGALVVGRRSSQPGDPLEATRSDDSGAFVLRGLPPGRYSTAALSEGLAPAIERGLEVSPRRATRRDLLLGAPSSVSGRVVDRAGSGIGGARVHAFPLIEFGSGPGLAWAPYGDAVADPEGRFLIGSLCAGEHRVAAEAPGFGSAGYVTLQVPAGDGIDGVELVLDAGKSLAGRVRGPDGVAVADASVRAEVDFPKWRPEQGRILAGRVTVRTTVDGSFRMGGFGDAPLLVEASHPDHGSRRLESVAPGRVDLELRLPGRTGIAGTVREAEGGAPVRLFSVEFGEIEDTDPTPFHFRSNLPARSFDSSEGSFEIVDLKSSRVGLRVTASGFVLETLPEIDVKQGEVRRDVEVRLRRAGSVRGTVVEEGSEKPVAGVEIYWHAEREAATIEVPSGRGYSGPDGSFHIQGIPPGKASFELVGSRDLLGTRGSVEVRSGETTEGIRLSIRLGGALEGIAAGPDGFSYVGAKANVSSIGGPDQAEAPIAGDGRFRVERLRPGKYSVVVPPPSDADLKAGEYGERILRGIADVEEGKVARVEFPEPARGICTVRGRLLRGGAGVERAHIFLFPAAAEASPEARALNEGRWITRTGSDGAFEIRGVPAGDARIRARLEARHSDVTLKVRIPDAHELLLDLRVPSGRVEGRVRRAADLAPLSEVSLELSRGEGRGDPIAWSRTDGEGRYAFGDLEPGTYAVAADGRVPGKEAQADLIPQRREGVRVVEAEPAAVDFLLEAGGAARVLVRGPDGEPVEDLYVLLRERGSREGPASPRFAGRTQREGVARLGGIPPGAYVAHVGGSKYAASRSEERTVRAGEEVEFRVDLERGTSLRIACAGADGSRVGEPRIRVLDSEGREVLVSFQEGGGPESKFATSWWAVLVPGDYSVEGQGRGYRTRTVPLRVDASGPKEFLVPLEREESPK